MSTTAPKKPYRKRRLFPRSLSDALKDATKPLMSNQGKLYGALLRDWKQIVGAERGTTTRPQRLQFPTTGDSGAILHIDARPAVAPELAYATEQMLEQCARYFGYRAIARIVIHATHEGFSTAEAAPARAQPARTSAPSPGSTGNEMEDVLARLAVHIASASDKKK